MRPVIIAGPTASGKSALALALAERDGGVIVNADALQVYACWQVLTARPDAAALARAPHHLYGHVACDAPYSVGIWLREVAAILDAADADGRRLIIVGGTGLYLTALTSGLAAIPPIPAMIRTRSTDQIAGGHVDRMRADLARDDPDTYARIDRANPMRVQRAWEVLVATGRGLAAWHRETTAPILDPQDAVRVVLDRDTSLSNRDISDRFKKMLEDGALDECARFRSSGLTMSAPSGRALGARELVAHLEGRTGLAEATDAAVVATRRYAKRQRTWFRNRFSDWTWLDPGAEDPLAAIPRD